MMFIDGLTDGRIDGLADAIRQSANPSIRQSVNLPIRYRFTAKLKSPSRRIVSATLSTTGTRGCVMEKSAKVNAVAAVPTTAVGRYRAFTVHVVGLVTPLTVTVLNAVALVAGLRPAPSLPPTTRKEDLLKALNGHIIGQTELMGTYQKIGRI